MKRSLLFVALATLLLGLWKAELADAADKNKQQQNVAASQTPSAPANASDFVGSETCTACHEEVSKGFGKNPHTHISLMHGGTVNTCESCHGPAGKLTWKAAAT